MKLALDKFSPTSNLPEGFYYIGQDNYYIANLNKPNTDRPEKYLYSDSATSCVIIIVEGKDKADNPIVAMSHLSRKDRFLRFFEIVAENFVGPVFVFAQGANPQSPGFSTDSCQFSYDSLQNQQLVVDWVSKNIYLPTSDTPAPGWYIQESTVALGLGNPQEQNRGCYGIDLNTMTVTNQPFILSDVQRDPTLGLQVLYCVFGLKVSPRLVLQYATVDFTADQIKTLVAKAKDSQWLDILTMTNAELLNKYSSTPMYEVPWFFSLLRESALYVKNYLNN